MGELRRAFMKAECSICFEDVDSILVGECGHTLCADCVSKGVGATAVDLRLGVRHTNGQISLTISDGATIKQLVAEIEQVTGSQNLVLLPLPGVRLGDETITLKEAQLCSGLMLTVKVGAHQRGTVRQGVDVLGSARATTGVFGAKQMPSSGNNGARHMPSSGNGAKQLPSSSNLTASAATKSKHGAGASGGSAAGGRRVSPPKKRARADRPKVLLIGNSHMSVNNNRGRVADLLASAGLDIEVTTNCLYVRDLDHAVECTKSTCCGCCVHKQHCEGACKKREGWKPVPALLSHLRTGQWSHVVIQPSGGSNQALEELLKHVPPSATIHVLSLWPMGILPSSPDSDSEAFQKIPQANLGSTSGEGMSQLSQHKRKIVIVPVGAAMVEAWRGKQTTSYQGWNLVGSAIGGRHMTKLGYKRITCLLPDSLTRGCRDIHAELHDFQSIDRSEV